MFGFLFKAKVRKEIVKGPWKKNIICSSCTWFSPGAFPFSGDCCPSCGCDLVFKKGRSISEMTTDWSGGELKPLYFELWKDKSL